MCELQAPHSPRTSLDLMAAVDAHNYINIPLPCHLLCAYFILLHAIVHTLLRASIVYVFLSSVENKIMVILEYNNELECA
jgi:hypothetical protein